MLVDSKQLINQLVGNRVEVSLQRVLFPSDNMAHGLYRNQEILIFLKSDLAASDCRRCELIETKFENSRLDLISAQDIKCWKSNELIEIKMSSNFKEILKNLECVEE